MNKIGRVIIYPILGALFGGLLGYGGFYLIIRLIDKIFNQNLGELRVLSSLTGIYGLTAGIVGGIILGFSWPRKGKIGILTGLMIGVISSPFFDMFLGRFNLFLAFYFETSINYTGEIIFYLINPLFIIILGFFGFLIDLGLRKLLSRKKANL